jgi:hypothetical protein
MAVPYIFGTIPNGQTIPLNYLDANFSYIENQISGIGGGVLTISGGSTGLLPNSPTNGNVVLSGVLNIANGGTGANTLSGLQSNIFPAQTGQAGNFLTTDGTNILWAAGGGTGVTSWAGGATGLTPAGSSTGAISIAGTLNIAHGGTGATTATAALTALLPAQSVATNGQVLTSNGTTAVWASGGGASSLTVGTTSITGGTSGKVLYDNAGVLGELTTTGTGNAVLQTTPVLTALRETKTALAIAAGVLAIDCNVATVFAVPLIANITSITFANIPPTGEAYSFILSFTASGAVNTVTWPASVKWPNGTAPTLTSTSGKVDTFVLYTYDAGANWYAFIAGQNA